MGQSSISLAATLLGNGLGVASTTRSRACPTMGPQAPTRCSPAPTLDAHHTAMLTRGDQVPSRGLGTPPAAMMSHLNGLHHPGHAQSHGPVLAPSRERPPLAVFGVAGGHLRPVEEINTKEVAQRITAELKRYSIPQAIRAEGKVPVSGDSSPTCSGTPNRGVNSNLAGRPSAGCGRLQEPEFQRMSALRLAGKRRGPSGVTFGGSGSRVRALSLPSGPLALSLHACHLFLLHSVSVSLPSFSLFSLTLSLLTSCLPSFLSDPRPCFVHTLLTVPTTLPPLSDLPQLWEARRVCAVSTRSPLFPRLPGTAGLPLFRTLCT